MNRTAAVVTGIAALAPASGFLAVPFVSDAWFPRLTMAVVAGGWVVTIGFLIFALRSSAVPKGKRGLWAALLLFGNLIVVPFFWFWYIWKADAPSQETGT